MMANPRRTEFERYEPSKWRAEYMVKPPQSHPPFKPQQQPLQRQRHTQHQSPRTEFVQQSAAPSGTASDSPPVSHPSFIRDLGALAFKIAAISICFALIFTFIYGFHRYTGPEMSPMVKDGDMVLFHRIGKDYAIGDLVLLDYQGQRQVRRVVAKAGDTVDITDDGLIINGGLVHEPSIFQQTWHYATGIPLPITIGENQIFVLGDAREDVTDSREYGPVSTDNTLGKAITIIRRRGL